MIRRSFVRPGYDCIRNPCGRGNCGKTPGGNHGIHCDDWIYVVSDGDCALSLTVFSGKYPDSVPPRSHSERMPCGADLTLHTAFRIEGPDPTDEGAPCEYVEGGRCYSGAYLSTGLGASEFVDARLVRARGFDQPKHFWIALEAECRERSEDARARRVSVCPHCGGKGTVRP